MQRVGNGCIMQIFEGPPDQEKRTAHVFEDGNAIKALAVLGEIVTRMLPPVPAANVAPDEPDEFYHDPNIIPLDDD